MSLDLLALKTLGPAAYRGSAYKWTPSGPVKRKPEEDKPKTEPKMSDSEDEAIGYETEFVPATDKQVLTIVKSFLKRVVKGEETPDFSAVYQDAEGATETEGKRRFLLRSKKSYLHTLQNKGQKGAEVVIKNSEGKVVQRLRFHVVFHEHLNVTQEEMDGKGDPSAKEVAKSILSALRKPGVTLASNHFTIPTKKVVKT